MGNARAIARHLLVLAAFALPATVAAKGHLQARPTLVEIAAQAGASRFLLANTGDAPVAAQVRVFAWSQVDGEDRLTPTQDVVLSPPIARVEAGGEQVVRVVRTFAPPTGMDRTYRLVVDELPGARVDPVNAVSVRMQYVIPLFVRAGDALPPALACRIEAATLRCRNGGGQAAQLGRSQLVDAGGKIVALSAGLFGYVLPLCERRWTLDPAALASLAGPLRLETQLNGQAERVVVDRSP